MSEPRRTSYTEFHPRWYRRRVSTWWWLGRWSYLKFILREISSVFVAWFVLQLLLLIYAVSQGPHAYSAFQRDWLHDPAVITLNIVSLFFVIFHAVTWFNLAPAAMVVRLGGKKVPGVLIAASNYAAWVVVSVGVGWLILNA
jgi:fumarate reductase subunit C